MASSINGIPERFRYCRCGGCWQAAPQDHRGNQKAKPGPQRGNQRPRRQTPLIERQRTGMMAAGDSTGETFL